MNENLNLVEILKDAPKGTKLWSPIFGDVRFDSVRQDKQLYPIYFTDKCGKKRSVTSKGLHFKNYNGECMLFPSKDQRDWNKFKAPAGKFDYSTLKPFDKVLVRDADSFTWKCALFTCMKEDSMTCSSYWRQGIPYNEETKHLAGATDKPDEKYIWWEE